MSITFQLSSYVVTCSLISEKLTFRLEPVDLSNKSINHYIYQMQFTQESFPDVLKFVFLQGVVGWFKYIQYYKDKCMVLDLDMIRKDEESEMIGEISYGEVPLFFKMIVLEGLKESMLKLYGSREPYSKEERLEKLLTTKDALIEDLGRKILDKERLLDEKNAELLKVKRQLAQKIAEIEELNERINYQELPRKRIHNDDSKDQQRLENDQNQVQDLNQSKKGNSRNLANSNEIIEELAQTMTQNSQKLYNQNFYQENNQVVNLRTNQPPIVEQQSNLHEQSQHNHLIQRQSQEPISYINQVRQQRSNSMHNENKHDHELEKVTQVTNNREIQQQVSSQESDKFQPNSTYVTSVMAQQKVNPSSGLYEDKHVMVRDFSHKKCLMQVGFDEKGNKKYGFSCVFCDKVFKEDEFLFKHLTTRHPNYVNNETTMEFLTHTWNDFKRRRQQRVLMAQANMIKEKKSERLDNAITRLTMK